MANDLDDISLSVLMLMGLPPEKHGSFEDFAIHICREMSARGHVAHLAYSISPPEWLQKQIDGAGGKLAPTKLIKRPWAPGSLWRYLKSHHIDLIHLHLVNTLTAWLLNQITGTPLVLTLHVAKDYSGGHWMNRAAAVRARLLYRSATLISITDFMYQYALSLEFGLSPHQIIRIYNGVDTTRFKPVDRRERIRRKIGWKSDAIMFITVSHLRKDKGLDVLLDAFSKAASDCPRIELAVVGDGPELEALKALAQRLNITGRVHWLGQRNDVDLILPGADCFLLTPTWEEPFGYVFAEAQSSGLPVITCRSGGIPEIIDDQKTGIILEKNDVNGLAAAIAKTAIDKVFRNGLARNARKRMLARFDIRNQAKAVVDLYETKHRQRHGPGYE